GGDAQANRPRKRPDPRQPEMDRNPPLIKTDTSESMRLHGVGVLPVFDSTEFQQLVGLTDEACVEGHTIVGMVTDRDIVTRGLTDLRSGFDPDMEVAVIMSRGVVTCYEDQDVLEAVELMGERRIRRLLVLDMSDAPVGILSLGDIAEHVSEELAGHVLGEVSELRARDERVRPAHAMPPYGVP
ncbi:CBS domain-containing protein, partial [Roseovarius sp. D22-M7]|uniref:CBS domain-containing protein n=1 Tax=Roseovarius sp. D22-M7 TaxID=3127116 RepID=UPI003010297B